MPRDRMDNVVLRNEALLAAKNQMSFPVKCSCLLTDAERMWINVGASRQFGGYEWADAEVYGH